MDNTCGKCRKGFSSIEKLNDHWSNALSHHPIKRLHVGAHDVCVLVCPYCHHLDNSIERFQHHVKRSHRDKRFANNLRVKVHIIAHWSGTMIPEVMQVPLDYTHAHVHELAVFARNMEKALLERLQDRMQNQKIQSRLYQLSS